MEKPTFEKHRIRHRGAIGGGIIRPPWYLTEVSNRWSKAHGAQIFYYRFNDRAEFDKCMSDPTHRFHPR